MPSFDIDINFNINNESLTEAEEELEALKDSAEETQDPIDSANESMNKFEESTEETNEKMQETTDSAMGLGEALVGIGGAVGLDSMIATGDNINTSWNRLSLTFEGTGVQIDTLKAKSSELNAETGRSGSEIREYFNQMGLAGVTNTDLLTSSFEALSGKSYQTGNSMQSMTQKMSMMSMSGNASARMLKNLGINTSDLANAMGVTEDQVKDTFKAMSQEERLQALTDAMGDGTKANDMYKNSYAGLKAQAEASIAGLTGAIGQAILPIIIPAMQSAKQGVDSLTATFKGLPAPVQSLFGIIGGGLMGVTALVTSFSLLAKVLGIIGGSVGKVIALYGKLTTVLTSVRTAVDMMRNAESLSAGIKAVLTTWLGAERVAQLQNAMAKTMALPSTIALAIAENSLLLPILLVIGAIVALVAILWYLYNNNETVRQSIDWLIEQFQLFINQIMQVGNNIASFVSYALGLIMSWVTGSSNGANDLVNKVVSAIATLPNKIQSAISGVANILTKPFRDAYDSIVKEIDKIGQKANELNPMSWFSGAEYEGFSSVGYEGFSSLNSTISNGSTNSATTNNNFYINGIIEEEASQYIVGSVNDYIKKQNLRRGV